MIVSERLAMSIFGTTDVVGRSIVRLPARAGAPSTTFRIVGVVGDIQRTRIEDGYTPMAYFPLLRDGDGLPADSTAVPYRPKESAVCDPRNAVAHGVHDSENHQ